MKTIINKCIGCYLLCLAISGACLAQKDTAIIVQSVLKLEKALIDKDSATLVSILHEDLAYGHSNGWVQTKNDVLKDMASGYMVYSKIENRSMSVTIHKNYAVVKEKLAAEGSRDGNNFKLDLFVLQLWVSTKEGWLLLMRQSTRLPA